MCFLFFQIVFYTCHIPVSRFLAGLCMGSSDEYHYHYNEICPIRGIHEFFLYPGKERLTRVRAHQRLGTCHEEREDIRHRYRGVTVMTFDGPVVCPP